MELTLERTRSFVAVSVVTLIVAGLSVTFLGPSGVVVPSGGLDNYGRPGQWHLCRLPTGRAVVPGTMWWDGHDAGCKMPGVDGHSSAHAVRLHVRPGNYLLTTGSPSCWSRAQVTVSPHRFVAPSRWESMSCSIQ